MPRGYRYAVAAALGLSPIAFGLGAYLTPSNPVAPDRYQSYRYAADKPVEVEPATAKAGAIPLEHRTPCQEPKGKDESDLCAQWRAAEAAENSALWAKWGFWIGVIGSTLLLWQIILTRRAVKDTGEATEAMREANNIARDASARQLRPYLVQAPMEQAILSSADGESLGVQFVMNFTNTGGTPAIDVEVFAAHKIMQYGSIPAFTPNISEGLRGAVGAGLLCPCSPQSIGTSDFDRLKDGSHVVWLYQYCDYKSMRTGDQRFISETTMRVNYMGSDANGAPRWGGSIAGPRNTMS